MHRKFLFWRLHNHPQVYACRMGPKCRCYRVIVATNGWVVFWQQRMYKDRLWMWNIICKSLLGHGSCTIGCCATRTFRWVYAWISSMLLSLQPPVLQPVTEHYTQGTCEGTTLKCEKSCVAWSRRLWKLIGRRLSMWSCTRGTHAWTPCTSVCIFAMVSGGHN